MPKKILLSIKPEFVEKIFNGEKKYEYRKVLFKDNNVESVVIYASSPVQKVVGEFRIGEILSSKKNKLWENTHHGSGISKNYFDEYFRKKEHAYAIEISELEKYETPKSLQDDLKIKHPPQSFVYLD